MIDWQRIWNDDENINRFSPARAILYLLSFFYRLIVNLRNWLYDKRMLAPVKLDCPVISVGNITVGGTGKTPCVIMLAQMLQAFGFRPAVISRGYGGKSSQEINIVSDGERILLDSAAAGDEPLLIARSLRGVPVITGARRIQTGSMAINRFGVNVLICDDAFQHRQIARDINLVLLDSEKPLGNGHLLPRGELREPVRGLNRASCVMLTRADETKTINKTIGKITSARSIPLFYSIHQPREIIKGDDNRSFPIGELQGKSVCAFCGIAKPDSFKKNLLSAGADILSFDPFPDHYRFSAYDLEELKNKFVALGADYLMTTQKDITRIGQFPDFLKIISFLVVEMKIIPARGLFEKFILENLATRSAEN